MRRFGNLVRWQVLGALPLVMVAAGRAAEETPVISVQPEVLTEGITLEEYGVIQQALHTRLMENLPDRVHDQSIDVTVTAEELADLATPSLPRRIGVVKALESAVALRDLRPELMSKRGALREMTDGGFVWARSITSAGAGGIRVHLTGVSLPPGADLYFFSATGEAFGPYQLRGPSGDGDFWTESVFSESGVLVLEVSGQVSAADLRKGSFTITGVGHIDASFVRGLAGEPSNTRGGSFCGNEPCVEDATCHNVSVVSGVKNAVAKMEWVSGAFLYTCTGGLLADTDSSTQIPYFLTANHCLNRNREAQNVEFFWFYRTSSCNASCPNDNNFPRTLGSQVRATGSDGDFTLLQLSQNPPSGAVFLGWTSAAIAFTNNADLYRISHPNFGAQVYSQHRVDTTAPTCSGWPRGESIYSRDVTGATDGGSSGAPVVNASAQVVGQLSGACGFNVSNPCDSASNATVDGALAFYFSSVDDFLNPSTCQPTTEVCNDGVDNDCDGQTDCADSNCSGDPACGGSCGGRNAPCDSNDDCCSNNCRPNGRCR